MGPKVNFYFWVRVVVMLISLVGILTLMKRLNSGQILGAASAEVADICPSRVTSVSVIGRFAIVQDGKQWFRTGDAGERTELDPTATEKWFGQYCKLQISKEGANPGSTPIMTLAYSAGLPATLMAGADGIFTYNQMHFRSLELSQALIALENLPAATKPGQK